MRRWHAALAVIALLAAVGGAVFLWQPGLDSLHDDSVHYLIMAQAFSPWHAVDPVIRAALPYQSYPPLFPLLIALAGGAYDWRIAHLVIAAALGASVYFLGVYAREVTASAHLGFIAALVYMLLPGTWLNAKGILSEFPYMALVFATLAYHARLGQLAPTRRQTLGLAGLLAALLLTRAIGILLVIALVGAELLRAFRLRDAQRLKSLALAPAIALLAISAWYLLRPSAGQHTYVGDVGIMLQAATEDAVLWVMGSLFANATALVAAWLNALLIFWGDPLKPGYLLAVATGIFGLGATLIRAARGYADGLYCVLVMLLLLFWPYPGQVYRLAFPIVPLVLVNAFWAVRELLALRFDAARSERGASYVAVLPLAACVPAVLFYIVERARMPDPHAARLGMSQSDMVEFYRIPSGPSAQAYAHREIEVLRDLRRITETTPPGARVMWYTPNYVALLARRDGVPLTRPGNPQELAAQLRATQADYLYLANIHPRDNLYRQGDPLYPWLLARGFTEPVWYRGEPQRIESGLLKVDKEKIMDPQPSPR
jgi:4-amino-4-deoxy-L-arabinose transferase-like glycosyltransferase